MLILLINCLWLVFHKNYEKIDGYYQSDNKLFQVSINFKLLQNSHFPTKYDNLLNEITAMELPIVWLFVLPRMPLQPYFQYLAFIGSVFCSCK